MRKVLVALDNNHIKSYVFGTDRLREIRGASALLDELNREGMKREIEKLQQDLRGKVQFQADTIYVNGGSGLFIIVEEETTTDQQSVAEMFGQAVKRMYQEKTQGGASVTYVVHELPKNLPDKLPILRDQDLSAEFEMLRYRLHEAKNNPPNNHIIALPSHPFMRLCDSCGINYAEIRVADRKGIDNDPDDLEDQGFYCSICRYKQLKDGKVKERLTNFHKEIPRLTSCENVKELAISEKFSKDKNLWARTFYYLNNEQYQFEFSSEKESFFPKRPKDFNVFSDFSPGRNYLGLIYADANNMGIRIESLTTLNKQAEFASEVDKAIHVAVSKAIKKHIPLLPSEKRKNGEKLFPFDILLLGGDDIVMLTDASKAVEVAHTIAQEFYIFTEQSAIIKATNPKNDLACTLSVGVVLAPIKYPFSLLLEMSENVLKAAKKESLKARIKAKENKKGKINDSCINFMVVTGGSVKDFTFFDKNVYRSKNDKNEFHATLRPYDLDSFDRLLTAIKEGHKRNLGRTKLHALREAVLQKNLTTSVSAGLAVLRNWRQEQREFALKSLYEFGIHAIPESNSKDPEKGFPRVTFPWFVDPQESKNTEGNVYRTTFLDFVELYDFVSREDGNGREEN